MSNMKLKDVVLNYEEVGSGSFALVHCHGLGGDGSNFVEELDFWNTYFGRVITWDNRGLGKSSQAAKYSMPLYAADLSDLLDKLGVEKAVLHGVSWGGLVVQQFALDYQLLHHPQSLYLPTILDRLSNLLQFEHHCQS